MGTLLSCFTTMRLVVFALVMLASYAAATTVDTCLKTGNTAFQPISISNEGDCTAYPSLPFPNTPTVDCLSPDVGAPGNAAAAEAANAGATEEEKVCHFNHVWYAPSVQPFPECPTLDNKPNCRMDGSVVGSPVDYAPFTKDWLCEMNHDLQVTPTSECFAFLRQSVCMRFDPDVLAKSLRVFSFAPAQKHQAHFESLALCSTPEICTFMNDKCGAATFSAPFELCGVQNCRSDRDCANWPFGDKSASCITAETTGMDSNRLLSECVPITPSCDAESCPSPSVCAAIGAPSPPPPFVSTGNSGDGVSSSGHASHPPASSKNKSGPSGGLVVLIIFLALFFAFAGYCVVGIVYNRFNGASGADQIPNAAFWSSIGTAISSTVDRIRNRGSNAPTTGFSQLSLDPPDYDFDA